MKNFDVIVIGAGPAGVTAALRAAELGARSALIERRWMGGTCTNDGCVPTRVLAKTARLMRETHHFGSYGLMGVSPTVDFGRLLAYAQGIVQKMLAKKQVAHHLTLAGVDIFDKSGGARFVDEHTLTLSDGSSLRGDKIIICGGGHARRFAFPGSESALTHSDVWSLKRLPRSVAIVGAAATGCQLATVLSAFGSQVYLLEAAPRILAIEDAAVSEAITAAFKDSHTEVITGISGVERINTRNGARTLYYTHNGESRSLSIEAVMLAVGWLGNIDDLNLAKAGVKTERGYVVVNDSLQTTTPNIFAAGDITGRVMLVQTANHDGRLAAENAVLGNGATYKHLIVPHGGFTDPEYAGVGLTEVQARAAHHDCVVASVPYADLDRAVIDGHTEGFCKLIVSRSAHAVIGAHVVGEQALEIVHLAAAAMAANMRIEQLAELELAYPTFTAIIGLAARQIVRELGIMPVAPQWGMLSGHGAEWEHGDH